MNFDDSTALLPQWLRPPTWRWAAATNLAAQYSPNTRKLPSLQDVEKAGYGADQDLLTAARYYRISRTVNLGGARVARNKYPQMFRASMIFKGQHHYAFWKMCLEAMLLTRLSLEDIAVKLGVANDVELIRTYRNIYFDVNPNRDSEATIQMNVIAMSSKGESLEPTPDYLSKMIAYIKGYDTFYRLFISRSMHMLTDEDALWIQNVIKSQVGMRALSVAASKRTDYIEAHLNLLRTGKEWLEKDSADIDILGQQAKTQSVATLLEAIHDVMDRGEAAATELTTQYSDYMDVDWSTRKDKDEADITDIEVIDEGYDNEIT